MARGTTKGEARICHAKNRVVVVSSAEEMLEWIEERLTHARANNIVMRIASKDMTMRLCE